MSVIIDGDQAYKVFSPERGLVNVALRWFSADGKQEERPAMFLYPKPHVRKDNAGTFVIPLDVAYQYQGLDLGHQKDLHLAITAANDAAKAMKLDVDKFVITNICDVIFNYLPDLIQMPPKRMLISEKQEQDGKEALGEMILKLDGQTIHEQEVIAP